MHHGCISKLVLYTACGWHVQSVKAACPSKRLPGLVTQMLYQQAGIQADTLTYSWIHTPGRETHGDTHEHRQADTQGHRSTDRQTHSLIDVFHHQVPLKHLVMQGVQPCRHQQQAQPREGRQGQTQSNREGGARQAANGSHACQAVPH